VRILLAFQEAVSPAASSSRPPARTPGLAARTPAAAGKVRLVKKGTAHIPAVYAKP
jgi:hypothetical protein